MARNHQHNTASRLHDEALEHLRNGLVDAPPPVDAATVTECPHCGRLRALGMALDKVDSDLVCLACGHRVSVRRERWGR